MTSRANGGDLLSKIRVPHWFYLKTELKRCDTMILQINNNRVRTGVIGSHCLYWLLLVGTSSHRVRTASPRIRIYSRHHRTALYCTSCWHHIESYQLH